MTPPDGPSSGEVVYGLLRMADMDVALPLSALREVVPCPLELSGLPAAAPGLLGALELRRLVLPVLDLAAVLGRPAPRRPEQVVVVASSGGQVLGLLADEVRGICQVPGEALVAARTETGGLLFSATFRHPGTGQAYSVLDAAAILGLPGVPTVTDVTRDPTSVGGAGNGVRRRTLTVLRCGPYRFAVDAAHVHTTLPTPDLRPSVLTGRLCRGVVDFSDREVPVVDPLALLGLGELAPQEMGAGLVLDLGPGYVALALSELLELVDVPDDDVLPTPPFATPRPDVLAGMLAVDGLGDCLVLDGPALLADPDLTGFASVNTALTSGPVQQDDVPSVAAAVAGGAPSYLVFSIGVDLVAPLDQVAEILPFPGALTATAVEGVLGLVTHRRAAVPVLCLATLLGRTERPVGAATCLLLVDVAGCPVAFAVDALRTIAPLTWTDPEQVVRGPAAERGASLRSAPLVRVGEDPRLLPELDLRAVARRLQGRPAPSPTPAPGPRGAPPWSPAASAGRLPV
ncbi:chemotaxis protein CheW [Blastococcus xanthinilyticus]|uniref:Purine-binding chemotaxis protein CheW n=1 Tax=Blastococcus xanthinilyticus TaxID=1564164 RepID=A0A5S5D1G8_9ACTN|nr:chemotaxis protein CheW [Blastococcus xanthinilyticus]TYP88956.1 purine-binding chemotaxis protein CheW [Blastococcus xanthinilyticus]